MWIVVVRRIFDKIRIGDIFEKQNKKIGNKQIYRVKLYYYETRRMLMFAYLYQIIAL